MVNDWGKTLVQCGVRQQVADRWAATFRDVIKPGTFTSRRELCDFLAQVLHESAMLTKLEEGLSYSAERLMAVWPKRFPTLASAQIYARQPQKLANHVYASRMGNGNDASGDGYRYRGRGLIQITGKDNYRAVGGLVGFDLLKDPDALTNQSMALRASIAWWKANVPSAAIGDVGRITRIVNGGTHGLSDRISLATKALEAVA
jgi:putative chitinase